MICLQVGIWQLSVWPRAAVHLWSCICLGVVSGPQVWGPGEHHFSVVVELLCILYFFREIIPIKTPCHIPFFSMFFFFFCWDNLINLVFVYTELWTIQDHFVRLSFTCLGLLFQVVCLCCACCSPGCLRQGWNSCISCSMKKRKTFLLRLRLLGKLYLSRSCFMILKT